MSGPNGKRHLPVLGDTANQKLVAQLKLRVVSIETDFDDTLTAKVRVEDSFLEEEVIIDLIRSENGDVRELLRDLYAKVLEKRTQAPETNCGTCTARCCTTDCHQLISLSDHDVVRLAAHLKMDRAEVEEKYLEPINSVMDDRFRFRFRDEPKAPGGKCCPFLKYDAKGHGSCGVHPGRPRICREYPAHGCDLYLPANRVEGEYRLDRLPPDEG
jgi:Fe-S-cluster containining protein